MNILKFGEAYASKLDKHIIEKFQLLPYILRNPTGTYLDIGTGGNSWKSFVHMIPQNKNLTLVASDLEESMLELFRNKNKKYFSIFDYENSCEGNIKVITKIVRAETLNYPINSLQGINVSAVMHEVFSYTNEELHNVIEGFITSLRVGGILTYRDPQMILKPNDIYTLISHDYDFVRFSYMFINICLPSYKKKKIYIDYIKTNLTKRSILDLTQGKTVKLEIKASGRIIQELVRHYITFCNDFREHEEFFGLIMGEKKKHKIVFNSSEKAWNTIAHNSHIHPGFKRLLREGKEEYFYGCQKEIEKLFLQNGKLHCIENKSILRESHSKDINSKIVLVKEGRRIQYEDRKLVMHFKKESN